MYLLKLNNGKIESFSFNPKREKIKLFKQKELGKGEIFVAKTNNVSEKHFEKKIIDKDLLNTVKQNLSYIPCYGNVFEISKQNNQVINDYYNGLFDNKDIAQVYCKKGVLEYYLITNLYIYNNIQTQYNFIMENIIKINKNLYLLQNLLQGNLNDITNNDDISDLVSLFEIDSVPRYIIDIKVIENAKKYDIINESSLEIEKKLEASKKILKYIK